MKAAVVVGVRMGYDKLTDENRKLMGFCSASDLDRRCGQVGMVTHVAGVTCWHPDDSAYCVVGFGVTSEGEPKLYSHHPDVVADLQDDKATLKGQLDLYDLWDEKMFGIWVLLVG